MTAQRRYRTVAERLNDAGLRSTRQRLGLASLLFDKGDRHITAEQLHEEAEAAGLHVSLATIYNTVNQFTEAGLLREVVVEAGRSYFDTNTSDHHHFFMKMEGRLEDAPDRVTITGLPEAPPGTRIDRVDVIIRLIPAESPQPAD